MKLEELPLLDIFNSLRSRHGLLLGVDEYLAVLRSFQAGFGIGNRQELEQLCCMLWAKSEEENRLILRLFGEMWKQIESHCVNVDLMTTENSPVSLNETRSSTDTSTLTTEESSFDEPLPDLETPPSITPEPVQAVQAVRSSRGNREMKRPRYMLLTDYFPVTKRQMKQCWRYLRCPVRQGVSKSAL